MNLVIDIGNTQVKVAIFINEILHFERNFKKRLLLVELKGIENKYDIDKAIIASVALISDNELREIKKMFPLLVLNSDTPVPFINEYKTPDTLGVDRIALVASAVKNFPEKNVLIIDAGTCITYDFKNDANSYSGGSISIGVNMRYKALHIFTDKLPLLKPEYPKNLKGNDTENSIHSGVINGVLAEINGVILQYKEQNQKLTVVLTGGDAIFLAKRLKNGIFANPNFLLEGLNTILIYNS